MIFVTFGKMTSDQKLKHHFSKGRDGIEKVLHSLQEVLEKENIPISASGDYKINDIELSPFSGEPPPLTCIHKLKWGLLTINSFQAPV